MSDFGEPLEVVIKRGKLYVESDDGRSSGAISLDDNSWLLRAIECTNAIAGIADPAAFVERAKAMEVLLRRAAALGMEPAETILFALSMAEWSEDA